MSVICIDFDGTCVEHKYPVIGGDIGAVPVLKRLISCGNKIILFTMRSGEQLDQAINWFSSNEIPLFGVNVNPTQKKWTESPKAYGNLYIDDAALGIPLVKLDYQRPYVDWVEVENLLIESGFIR